MAEVVITEPILNSPFREPDRHYFFDDEGITNTVVESRRPSSYFVPIPAARTRSSKQLALDTEWTQDRVEANVFVNRIRDRVAMWRQGGYAGVTPTTLKLLRYWTNSERENKLFFAQIEALETVIYIAEVANKYGDGWIPHSRHSFIA